MATTGRKKNHTVTEKLFAEPFRFSFFQAVRLLQGLIRQWHPQGQIRAVGHDHSPKQESLRFSSIISHNFSASEITKIGTHQPTIKHAQQPITEMQIAFFALNGPTGVLPTHYTEIQITQLREKDRALTDFLDMLNHRSVSLFYRAWEKYQLPLTFEQAQLNNPSKSDPITAVFESLLGLPKQINKQATPADTAFANLPFIHYAGFFATPKNSAESLAAFLQDYFDIEVQVEQFKGEWLTLSQSSGFALPQFPYPGKNNRLGIDTVIGNKVFVMEGKFNLILGPLNQQQFDQLMPDQEKFRTLCHYTRHFVGPTLCFDVVYQLRPETLKTWRLDSTSNDGFRLGWNTWLNPSENATQTRTITVNNPG